MMKQKHISQILGIDQSDVSRFINGKKKLSWPYALKLSKIFPARTVEQWKNASPEQLKSAFSQLQTIDVKEEV